jgi:hypothetical protein
MFVRLNVSYRENQPMNGPGSISTQIPALIAEPAYQSAHSRQYFSRVGLTGHYEGSNHHGDPVVLECVKQLQAGETVDLTEDIQPNYDYFTSGPGYSALE